MELTHVTHVFPPLFDERCSALILGSIPSPKSREQGFYYGHPQNRFWRVMAAVWQEPCPVTIEEKSALMLRHHTALWDTLEACDIIGAGDSTVKDPVPTDLEYLLRRAPIKRVFTTGAAADRFYRLFHQQKTGIPSVRLPSTSPANCAVSLEQLIEAYRVIANG